MLRHLSRLSIDQIVKRLESTLYKNSPGFTIESLNNAPIPSSAIEFLKKHPIPEHTNAVQIGGFRISDKINPDYGNKQFFPKIREWVWRQEFKKPFPEYILDSIVIGETSGGSIREDGSIVGFQNGTSGPICMTNEGKIVFYPENENYKEFVVNSDIEKFLYCIAFFRIMVSLSQRKTKKNPFDTDSIRPDYCDTIYDEMRIVDLQALEPPNSFWSLKLDLVCFKHPLANGYRRYPKR